MLSLARGLATSPKGWRAYHPYPQTLSAGIQGQLSGHVREGSPCPTGDEGRNSLKCWGGLPRRPAGVPSDELNEGLDGQSLKYKFELTLPFKQCWWFNCLQWQKWMRTEVSKHLYTPYKIQDQNMLCFTKQYLRERSHESPSKENEHPGSHCWTTLLFFWHSGWS